MIGNSFRASCQESGKVWKKKRMQSVTEYMCTSYLPRYPIPSHPNPAGREVVILMGFTNIMPSTCVQKDEPRYKNTTGKQPEDIQLYSTSSQITYARCSVGGISSDKLFLSARKGYGDTCAFTAGLIVTTCELKVPRSTAAAIDFHLIWHQEQYTHTTYHILTKHPTCKPYARLYCHLHEHPITTSNVTTPGITTCGAGAGNAAHYVS